MRENKLPGASWILVTHDFDFWNYQNPEAPDTRNPGVIVLACDKGHFIAHTIGGAVDGLEANVFLQRRSVNRGAYRQMERCCAAHAGVLCFSRPIYDDPTAVPAAIEIGVLKPDVTWWIQRFPNR